MADKKITEEQRLRYNKIAKEKYQKNKEKILKKRYEKITCDICNISFNRGSKCNHLKSNKHKLNELLQLKKKMGDLIEK